MCWLKLIFIFSADDGEVQNVFIFIAALNFFVDSKDHYIVTRLQFAWLQVFIVSLINLIKCGLGHKYL